MVTPPAKVTVGPVAGAANVTLAPETGFPAESVTIATRGWANAVFTFVLWPLPLPTVIFAAWPIVFVSVKLAEVAEPEEATTVYDGPACVFAVIAPDVATPDAFVVAVLRPPANVALGPVWAGAVNVTTALGTTLPPASVTVTTRGLAKAVETDALCPLPLVTAIFAAGPGLFVNPKFAVAVPLDATTL